MTCYRKTRIVCVSDTHGYLPAEAGFKLPAGDVLIHAGDLSNRGTKAELERTFKWIEEADYEAKIVIAGNHDVSLDSKFYVKHGAHFHGDTATQEAISTSLETIRGIENRSNVIYLNHESATIKLTRPGGPRTMFEVFGSPYSRFTGLWAFGYSSPEEGHQLWSQIPLDSDIVVTHTPPLGFCDRQPDDKDMAGSPSSGGGMYGCPQLLDSMNRVRPFLAVCGHVHEGRGYQRVIWKNMNDGAPSPVVADERTDIEPLPALGSKKQSLIDLTGKKQRALENVSIWATQSDRDKHAVDLGSTDLRRETCIINAAIVAKSWPFVGGKIFNRPIVVDVNLPVWDDALR